MSIGPAARTDLVVVEVDGEAVVYDERSAELHHLNSTATAVFGRLDGRTPTRAIAERMAIDASMPVDEIHEQIDAVVDAFGRAGLLQDPRIRDA